jgi:uncharacterized membrane protein YkvA (DUF1232 family)
MNAMRKLLRRGTLLRWLPLLPQLPNFMRLSWRLLRDRRVPAYLKSLVVLALLYVVSPFDIIPDFLFPGMGYVDDATLLLLIGYYLIHWSPQPVVDEHVAAIGGNFQRRFRQWSSRRHSPTSRFPPPV